jgi:hypothetical protein
VQMELFDFLSDKNNYLTLMQKVMKMVNKQSHLCHEEAKDIASDAMERILDYYQRKPQKLEELEQMEETKMLNYLKKALSNHVLNILIQKSNKKIKKLKTLADLQRTEIEKIKNTNINQNEANLIWIKSQLGYTAVDSDEICLDRIRRELFQFIQNEFKPHKQEAQKSALDLFINRIKLHLSLKEMQAANPTQNIGSLNTKTHRLFKLYIRWLKNQKDSLLFPDDPLYLNHKRREH